ncbi:DnaJ domain-containing protein [Sphingomonas sp. SAFR-052]|uniref:DnaJ domain-containing protein n=1 Tax=Sphingomonas sp. SAFR-052 TaxID=3436867 RepID=UPI003F80F05D
MTDTADPYTVLGIDRGADADQIKRAFRRMIARSHPDRSRDADAADRAAAIISAYRTLSDPERRRMVDRRRDRRPVPPGAERRQTVRRAADRAALTRQRNFAMLVRDTATAAIAVVLVAYLLAPDFRAYQRDHGDGRAIAAVTARPEQ